MPGVEGMNLAKSKIRIRTYPWDGRKEFYYEVKIGKSSEIRFVYKAEIREFRQLERHEVDKFLSSVKNLKLPLIGDTRNSSVMILPTIATALNIKTPNCSLDIVWTNTDSAQSPSTYRQLDELVEEIDTLLPISTNNLQLPVYL